MTGLINTYLPLKQCQRPTNRDKPWVIDAFKIAFIFSKASQKIPTNTSRCHNVVVHIGHLGQSGHLSLLGLLGHLAHLVH